MDIKKNLYNFESLLNEILTIFGEIWVNAQTGFMGKFRKKRKHMRTILTTLLLLTFLLVYGQTEKKHPIDIELQKCLDSKENSTTKGMTQCMIKAAESWDIELNKNYKTLLGLLNKEQKEKLKDSQRQWIRYRDSELEFSRSFYNQMQGTMWIPIASQTRLDLTKQRAQDLLDYISILTMNK
jgi:uncharacterized protein YecT (DUF1311 family)